jgi:hypothetical protein
LTPGRLEARTFILGQRVGGQVEALREDGPGISIEAMH